MKIEKLIYLPVEEGVLYVRDWNNKNYEQVEKQENKIVMGVEELNELIKHTLVILGSDGHSYEELDVIAENLLTNLLKQQ